MSPIRTIATALTASAVLSLSLLLGCTSQQTSGTVTPAPEAALSATPNPSAISSISIPPASSAPTSSAESPAATEGLISRFPLEGLANSVIIDSVNDDKTIRARTAAGQGELLMISSGPEERGHLNVSSNDGLEGEQTYQADYSIVYREDKQDQVLLKLPAFLFVRPSGQVLDFKRISFKKAEVYLLTPQYKSGHGLTGYAFAISKLDGAAFPLSFVQDGTVHDTLVYSELQPLPANDNEQLIVHLPVGAGGDPELEPRRYELDLDKQQFVAR